MQVLKPIHHIVRVDNTEVELSPLPSRDRQEFHEVFKAYREASTDLSRWALANSMLLACFNKQLKSVKINSEQFPLEYKDGQLTPGTVERIQSKAAPHWFSKISLAIQQYVYEDNPDRFWISTESRSKALRFSLLET